MSADLVAALAGGSIGMVVLFWVWINERYKDQQMNDKNEFERERYFGNHDA